MLLGYDFQYVYVFELISLLSVGSGHLGLGSQSKANIQRWPTHFDEFLLLPKMPAQKNFLRKI